MNTTFTNFSNHPALTLFRSLLLPSPSGQEGRVAAVIRHTLDELRLPHETDAAGNVIVRLPGGAPQAPACIMAAHMDEIGVVVTAVEAGGTLRVDRSGGLMPWKLGEGPLAILGDEETLTGVLSMGSTHRQDAAGQAITWADTCVITGLTPDQLAAAGVRPGTLAVPVAERRGPVIFGDPADPLVGAWTFDDRMGVVALLRLLQAIGQQSIEPSVPLLIAFTTREEIGGLGAKALCRREAPDVFISIDGAPMPPGAGLELDGRPAIWSKDRLATYDQRLLQSLRAAAQSAGTSLQPVVYDSAASDASLVGYAGLAPRIACVGHVRANSHGFEVSRFSVFDNVLNTLIAFLDEWPGD
jgi:putative aminopeptidase FrvX